MQGADKRITVNAHLLPHSEGNRKHCFHAWFKIGGMPVTEVHAIIVREKGEGGLHLEHVAQH